MKLYSCNMNPLNSLVSRNFQRNIYHALISRKQNCQIEKSRWTISLSFMCSRRIPIMFNESREAISFLKGAIQITPWKERSAPDSLSSSLTD
jgi:hypothetical protein